MSFKHEGNKLVAVTFFFMFNFSQIYLPLQNLQCIPGSILFQLTKPKKIWFHGVLVFAGWCVQILQFVYSDLFPWKRQAACLSLFKDYFTNWGKRRWTAKENNLMDPWNFSLPLFLWSKLLGVFPSVLFHISHSKKIKWNPKFQRGAIRERLDIFIFSNLKYEINYRGKKFTVQIPRMHLISIACPPIWHPRDVKKVV